LKCINDRTVLSTVDVHISFIIFLKFSVSSQNLFLLLILQHVIVSKRNYINTMLPNEMVLAPLQKLKIKYELSYQSTTRLKYIDKFHQLLIIHQWTSTVDNTVRSSIHFNIFYLIYFPNHFTIQLGFGSTPFPNYDGLQVLKTIKYWSNS
jgi:hypothetical protein